MVINRPSLKAHTTIFKGQETKARKVNALSKCIPVILIVTHVRSRTNPVSREIPSAVWLVYIPVDSLGLPVECIECVNSEVYGMFV